MLNFTIPDMSCNHCVKAITEAVKKVDSRAELGFDLERKTVSIDTTVAESAIVQALSEAGYPPG